MVMMVVSSNRLGQILNVGELAALRSIREVCGELVELARRVGVAVLLGGLRRALQVSGDLLSDLLVLSGIRLLKLLERAHQLRKWGKLALVR